MVKLWNRQGQLIETFTGHSGAVTSVAFSYDGQTIASASGDKTVILWNFDLDDLVAKSKNLVGILR
ncbi:WD40 repeat domain-containing protein [Moorena producens]|uniref:WD40 repeat domain-containing protein n=1 Tax=Moorena producens TaxID=1155739 RepID=UPI003C7361BC